MLHPGIHTLYRRNEIKYSTNSHTSNHSLFTWTWLCLMSSTTNSIVLNMFVFHILWRHSQQSTFSPRNAFQSMLVWNPSHMLCQSSCYWTLYFTVINIYIYMVAELSIYKWENQRGRIDSLLLWVSHLSTHQTTFSEKREKVLSDEHLGAKLRVTENWCVPFDSLSHTHTHCKCKVCIGANLPIR